MKKSLYTFLVLAFSGLFLVSSMGAQAQAEKAKQRPSPADTVKQQVGKLNVVITYSRPSVKDRKIWGALVPYDKVWRTGANDATTISFDKDVKIEGQSLAAGTYSLFTIPSETEWVIIFNKTAKQWGAYNYKSEDDVLRVKVKPGTQAEKTELFTISVSKKGVVSIVWDNVKTDFTIKP